MEKRFGTLRLVCTICRVLAWLSLVVGLLVAVAFILVGLAQDYVGKPSPLLAGWPILNQIHNLYTAGIAAFVALATVLVGFIALHAASDAIHLSLAVEQSAREAASYLRGEPLLPPPPQASTR